RSVSILSLPLYFRLLNETSTSTSSILANSWLDFFLHTGQHYSYNMDRIFFEKLHLPEPRFNIEIG
ncbi:MAG: hypothetical protein SCH70_12190, partial [Candidatus Methanoperedens sp.]|nr:hypothetical protein [Candidatus Methanoperedens sp.]